MKLKTLEISGFKSFADKTVIEFMPGMTGIVGPNGSGKSNIIEAMRWVMGEQSAKDLRGNKMSDVIFAGTSHRRALSRAEVSMTFDNSDHYVQSDFNEIRITRRLYRNGESVYQLNGADCRLRDIHNLFTDTGLGREGFSIISQGQVENVFSAKPEDRRGIIEEVAGVYKYKQNKQRAERELDQTADNLSRVTDIISEVEQRLEPLSQAASRARQYLELREHYVQLDQARLALAIQALRDQQNQQRQALADQKNAVKDQEALVAKVKGELADYRARQVDLQEQRENLQAQIVQDTQQREQLIGSQKLASQEIENIQAAQVRLATELTRLSGDQERVQADLRSRQVQLTERETVAAQLKKQLDELESKHGQRRLQDLEQRLAEGRHRYVTVMQDVASLRNNLSHNQKSQERLTFQLEKAQSALAEQKVAQNEAQTALEQYQQGKQAGPKQDTAAYQDKVDHARSDLAKHQTQIQQADQQVLKQQRELETLRSRYDALTAMDDYAGFYHGVRQVMSPQIKSRFPGIVGVVAELMQVPKKYTQAIETALGGALQQIVVADTATAKKIVAYLTKTRQGRVTLLPVDSIRPRRQPDLSQVQHLEGYLGLAADLVSMQAQLANICQNLLGTTVVATNLDAATAISKQGQRRFRVVTLDGQVVNPGGSITGGANQRQGSTLLSRRNQLNQLDQDIQAHSQRLSALNQSRDQLTTKQGQLQTDLQAALDQLREVQQASQAVDYELKNHQDQVKQQDVLVQTLTAELADLQAEQADLVKEASQAQDSLNQATTQEKQLEGDNQTLSDQLADYQDQHQDYLDKKADLQTRQATVVAQLEGDQSVATDLNQRLAELKKQQADYQDQDQAYQTQLDQAKDQLHLGQQVEALSTKLEQAQAAVEEQGQQWRTLTDHLDGLDQSFTKEQGQLNEHLAEQSRLTAHLDQVENRLADRQSELSQKYGQGADADLKGLVTAVDVEHLDENLAQVKASLNGLGDVNVGAINEYQEIDERYQFLTSQRDDLLAAKANLEQTITEMDGVVQKRFKETFDTVAHHFTRVFAQMFGGGQAELQLTDPEHLLTTGIDIVAQPPGKKFQRLSLLSGGEKALTAISLLFAILQVRPVPFVVLDEAEAALDEANVDRFANYLHQFGGQTQFIVITHRKGTMVNANLLYGVTMQEAGVSKIVAVNLDQASQRIS
ncbi:chromosome segregation protein SMC [Leuconostocaceae bacterium ESL0723]|nr:chromosome segregation protein SMC [Leuconostocaceae bacterium ESL0723]